MDLSVMTVAQIKTMVENAGVIDQKLAEVLINDSRAGVKEMGRRLNRMICLQEAEKRRLKKMYNHEDALRARGCCPVAGVDEAGRGSLAGPVVAAAVILPENAFIFELNDSKKLTVGKREFLSGRIKELSLAWAIGISTAKEIYRLNIHVAGLTAMRRAVLGLKIQPSCVLVDGFEICGLKLPQMAITGGDRLSASIAAASVLAKVTRDKIMDSCHVKYPDYGFNEHKGYATAGHLMKLRNLGPCPLHRLGYRPVRDCEKPCEKPPENYDLGSN